MASDEKQRKIFAFLLSHFVALTSFTLKELQDTSGWAKQTTFKTYLSKQFGALISENSDGTYRVNDTFRRYSTWESFRELVSQVRRTNSAEYIPVVHEDPVIFEFFLPLANEVPLREALDALFFRETIIARLKSRAVSELRAYWPGSANEDGKYIEDLTDWLGTKMAGYSIGQVSGRYRVGPLQTKSSAAKTVYDGGKYLIDEITAIVRFIFPVTKNQVEAIRFFFEMLFVQTILDVTNKEAEIWMVESGARTNLRIWTLKE